MYDEISIILVYDIVG